MDRRIPIVTVKSLNDPIIIPGTTVQWEEVCVKLDQSLAAIKEILFEEFYNLKSSQMENPKILSDEEIITLLNQLSDDILSPKKLKACADNILSCFRTFLEEKNDWVCSNTELLKKQFCIECGHNPIDDPDDLDGALCFCSCHD